MPASPGRDTAAMSGAKHQPPGIAKPRSPSRAAPGRRGTPRRVRDAPGRDPLVVEPLDGIERSRNGLVPDRKNTVDIDQYGFDAHDSSFSAVPGNAPGPPAAVGARRDRRMHPRTVPVASSPPSRPAPTVISTLTGHPVDEAGISGDDGSARVGWGGRPATGDLQIDGWCGLPIQWFWPVPDRWTGGSARTSRHPASVAGCRPGAVSATPGG